MAETFTLTKVKYAGQKDNPHGGTLYKFYVSLATGDSPAEIVDEVYWQRKSDALSVGDTFYGHIEQGEYGPRFKTDQKPDGSGNQGSSGGTFNRHFERVPDTNRDRSIERQVAAKCAAEVLKSREPLERAAVLVVTDWFHEAIRGADVGGGDVHSAGEGSADVSPASTADVSADAPVVAAPDHGAIIVPEASPAQKGKLTNLFGKAGLSRDAMKAVVLFRCRSEKATKDGASKLIQDLMDGATHDTLLAEIHDAKRAGDPLAIRAAKLIPSDVPLAEDPEEKAKEYEDESGVPF